MVVSFFILNVGYAAVTGASGLGVSVVKQPTPSQEDGTIFPAGSDDPASPSPTTAETEAVSQLVEQQLGKDPRFFGIVKMSRTMLGVKISYGECWTVGSLNRDRFGGVTPGTGGAVLETWTDSEGNVHEQWKRWVEPRGEIQLLPLELATQPDDFNYNSQSAPCPTEYQNDDADPSGRFFLFEYAGHSGSFWDVLSYLPEPLLPVAKWSWWGELSGDLQQEVFFAKKYVIQQYVKENYVMVCLHGGGMPPPDKAVTNICNLLNRAYGHDEYLAYVEGKYTEWGYDEESGQTFDKAHVTASCGGVWLAWSRPWGCAIETSDFSTVIYVGVETTISGTQSAATSMGIKALDIGYDVAGRATESVIVPGKFPHKYYRARAGCHVTSSGYNECTSVNDGWESGIGVVAMHPVMNDRHTIPVVATYWTPNYYGGNSGGNEAFPHGMTEADRQLLADYIKQLAGSGGYPGVLHAALFAEAIQVGYFRNDSPCGSQEWKAWWNDIDGSCQRTTPQRMIDRFDYFVKSNGFVDLFLRLSTMSQRWPPSDDPTQSSRIIYEYWKQMLSSGCGYWGNTNDPNTKQYLLALTDGNVADRLRRGLINDDHLWGELGTRKVACLHDLGPDPTPLSLTRALNLVFQYGGVMFDSIQAPSGETYTIISLVPHDQIALIPLGGAGSILSIYINDWWFLVLALAAALLIVDFLFLRKRRKPLLGR
jgi:hypothetical protein